jgi:hypothetical protein
MYRVIDKGWSSEASTWDLTAATIGNTQLRARLRQIPLETKTSNDLSQSLSIQHHETETFGTALGERNQERGCSRLHSA